VNRRAAAIAVAVTLAGCERLSSSSGPSPIPPLAEPSVTVDAPPKPPAPPPSNDANTLDLQIAFHPGMTTNIGWAKLSELVPLHMLGNPGAEVIDGAAYTAGRELKEYELTNFSRSLARADLSQTSLVVQESTLCSDDLREAVEKQQPRRVLINIKWGLTATGVACLNALAVPRLYLTGCLYRSHRKEQQCDGDAELAAIVAESDLRERVFGLAVSLSKKRSGQDLAKLPMLEYLAVVTGHDAEPGANLDALPFDALAHVRYLDITNWTNTSWGLYAAQQKFLARLHTLRWNSTLRQPLVDCELRRLSAGKFGDEDALALADCSNLVELSSDSVSLQSIAPLTALSALERLHLRHLDVENLERLAELENLRALSLNAAKAKDFSFLAKLTKLERIDLSQTAVASLEMLRRLTSLTHLELTFAPVTSLAPLEHLTNLVKLNIGHTGVSDLSIVAKLSSLAELSLAKTTVSDLQPLAKHPSLEWVIVRATQVTDIGPLFTLPKLRRANIGSLTLPPGQVEQLVAELGRDNVDH